MPGVSDNDKSDDIESSDSIQFDKGMTHSRYIAKLFVIKAHNIGCIASLTAY